MAQFEPVDFDPFAKAPAKGAQAPKVELEPVDGDPFAGGDDLKERGIILPIGTTKDGKPTLALPEIIHSPVQSFSKLWGRLSDDPNADPREYAGDAMNVAMAALTGPVGAGAKAAAQAAAPTATEAAARLGVNLPRAASGGMAESIGGIAKELPAPITGNPLTKAAETAATGIRDAGQKTIQDVGTGREPVRSIREWLQARGASPEALADEAGVIAREKQTPVLEAPKAPEGSMRIVTPDNGMEITAKPQVVELDDLRAAAGELQPRDRTRGEYVAGVRERAARLDPEQLKPARVSDSGAPIVLEDGTIISGNGRAMSIAEAYRRPDLAERANAYRASLGPEAANMRNPVRIMRAEGLAGEDAARFADLSNRGRIAQMSATERAARDAKTLGPEGVRLYQGGDFTAPQNEAFLRAFTSKAVQGNEAAALSKNGKLTQEGIQRLRNAVLASAYDDPALLSRMVESSDDNVRALTNALTDAAPRFSNLRADVSAGVVKPDLDPTKPVMEAVKKIAELRSQGSTPAQFFSQADAFEALDPQAAAWIKAFYNQDLRRPISRERMTSILNAYADEAGKHAPGGLFNDPTTAADVLSVALKGAAPDGVTAGVEGAKVAKTAVTDAATAAPMNSAEDRYINRMRAGGSEKTDAELRAAFKAKRGGVEPHPVPARPAPAKPTADDSLKAWQETPKTPQEMVFEARKTRLAAALGLDQNITPSTALNRIAEMTLSKASTDVAGLLKAKNIVDEETWSDIGREMLVRSGLGDDLAKFGVAYDGMTGTAKTALFGSEMKSRLDDLALASKTLGTLDELATPRFAAALEGIPLVGGALSGLLANRMGQAGVMGGLAVVDGGLASLPTAAASYATAKFLSRPQGSKVLSRWMTSLSSYVQSSGSHKAAFALATRNLARAVAEDMGQDEGAVSQQIDRAIAEAMKGARNASK